MKLLFSHVPKLATNIVKVLTRSRFSHVDFVIDNTTLFGALALKNACAYHEYEHRIAECKTAVLMDVPLNASQFSSLLKWVKGQEGKPYDWTSVLSTFSTNARNWREDDSWFCSELVAAGFDYCGKALVDPNVISRVVPEDLYRLPFEKSVVKGKK